MRFNRYNLIEAVKNNDINKINSILKSGKADINSKDKYCETALMRASWRGYSEIVKYLVEKRADINIKNNNGKTALDLADSKEIKEVLRKTGAK